MFHPYRSINARTWDDRHCAGAAQLVPSSKQEWKLPAETCRFEALEE